MTGPLHAATPAPAPPGATPPPPAGVPPKPGPAAAPGSARSPAPAPDEALVALLFALADDELIAGHRASEWTGVAPFLEEDVAFSSIAQDEVGHGALLYQLLADLGHGGGDPDALAFGRGPDGFRNAILLEQPNGDWAAEIARHFLYNEYEGVLWPAVAGSPYEPLAAAAARIAREEAYHRAHFRQWVVELGRAGGEARDRLAAALARVLPLAAGLFEPLEHEDRAAHWRGITLAELQAAWRAEVGKVLEQAGLAGAAAGRAGGVAGMQPTAPQMAALTQGGDRDAAVDQRGVDEPGWEEAGPEGLGGRQGRHSPALRELLDEMTSVYRSEPGAEW
ncbi:phenylacetate-CoA oxygenase, PaaI subunit [Thermaerobacter marianensis DSM 12885]|uniref:Phenylacetate-CoA oxygenase, PaaI subunit n=1 Tax=Thermaerobacter marianensis (strain ATCC 700841 / DSM 12885 / JCM 10246 / 7p75a) TaxID=644966 RepID=E6SJY2_THEM7|nr:1,2-phenylacetyl-CoA epoxidase subunit PaaC [Thermaerobacter marianensis]ADU52215.1 phenylacetate-CoA oxygenase, PaaI subunit [Thermaerobacter marianensis DSM 12885]